MQKKLYRSNINYKIAGVCGGYGEYFGIDPTFLRIAAVLLIFADGIGIIAYIVSWIAMPKRPLSFDKDGMLIQDTPKPEAEMTYSSTAKFLPGLILVVIGAVFLANNLWWWFDFGDLWPVLLIAVGAFLIFRMNGKSDKADGAESGEVSHDAR